MNINPNARLDGGDIIFLGTEIFVGLSTRTNLEGANFLTTVYFPRYRVVCIDLIHLSKGNSPLHLKSLISVCGYNKILVGGFLGKKIGKCIEKLSRNKYEIVYVPDEYAANVIFVNDVLIRRTKEEYPDSHDILKSICHNQIEVPNGELSKVIYYINSYS